MACERASQIRSSFENAPPPRPCLLCSSERVLFSSVVVVEEDLILAIRSLCLCREGIEAIYVRTHAHELGQVVRTGV